MRRIHLLRLSFRVSYFLPDLLLTVLFAVIGFLGLSRFPNYDQMKSVFWDTAPPFPWLIAIFLFSLLFVFRSIRSSYLYSLRAIVDAFVIHTCISTTVWFIVSLVTGFGSASTISALTAQQGCLGTLYLFVQGWLQIIPDVSTLRRLLLDLGFERKLLIDQISNDCLNSESIDTTRDICKSALSEAEAVLADRSISPKGRETVEEVISELKLHLDLLSSPLQKIKADLPELARETRTIHVY